MAEISDISEKIRCQSCGMPLSAEFGNLGTNADRSQSWEYCMYCYQSGAFTQPNQTLEEMIQSSIEYLTNMMKVPFDKASELSRSVIPKLKRWNKK